jgi:hypothetical protein
MLLWTSLLEAGGGFPPVLTLSGTPGPAGVGLAFSFTPTVSGGTEPYAFSLQSGILPDGLSLNGATGEVSGSPTEDGSFSGLVIRVTDSSSAIADLPITIEVAPAVTDPTFANVKLLFGFEGADGATTVTDESSYAFAVNDGPSDAEIDTAQFRFGSSSLLIQSPAPPGHYAVSDNAHFTLGSNDFTIEGHLRFSSPPSGNQVFLSHWHETVGRRSWALRHNSAGNLSFLYSTNGSNTVEVTGSWSPADDTWYYVAVSRIGSTLRLFLEDADGIAEEVAAHDIGAASINDSVTEIRIGAMNGSGGLPVDGFLGWLDEWRLTVGQGLYTQSFVAPQSAFPRS